MVFRLRTLVQAKVAPFPPKRWGYRLSPGHNEVSIERRIRYSTTGAPNR
jgi:hypothetical protein